MSTIWRPQFDGQKCGCVIEDYTTILEACETHKNKSVKKIMELNIEETIKNLDETPEEKENIRQRIHQAHGI